MTSTDALAVVEGYHEAWTSGDVDRAMAFVAESVACYAPDPEVTTKDQWRAYLSGFVPMLTGAQIRLAFDRLGYVPRPDGPE